MNMNIIKRLFDNRSKEEKERDFDMYSSHIFPFGDEQKKAVRNILSSAFPKTKAHYLMMHYILIKQEYLDGSGNSLEQSCKNIEKKKIVKITPEIKTLVRQLLPIDLQITEELSYPDYSTFLK